MRMRRRKRSKRAASAKETHKGRRGGGGRLVLLVAARGLALVVSVAGEERGREGKDEWGRGGG